MKLKTFIEANRQEIDKHINSINPGFDINDDERELWIRNDEALWLWAKNEEATL